MAETNDAMNDQSFFLTRTVNIINLIVIFLPCYKRTAAKATAKKEILKRKEATSDMIKREESSHEIRTLLFYLDSRMQRKKRREKVLGSQVENKNIYFIYIYIHKKNMDKNLTLINGNIFKTKHGTSLR